MTEITTSRPQGRAGNGTASDEAELPLDVEEADRAADEALGLKLGTTTREEIDVFTLQLRGQLALFVETVRDDGSFDLRRTLLEAEHLLDSGPADGVLVFNAWNYARDLARMLRRLVTEHRNQLDREKTALPTRSPLASLTRLAASRRAYSVPSGLPPQHRPMPTVSE
ncbi:DUF6415 family natural product biosynthesis protein [Streptomyces parvus]|uniref:Uncharacterized protein n=1 Tax=Streptomyces parvus TaxID=66428 RepID=A0A7K3S143_9ACTN|nr:DUF6415 family natural product biosynthesis protein [Streptomyces parvus]NEC21210.1 hypothetical protein [Streptomyces parvus]NEE29957.1 hypothetical protein [Streptomyces sp. SID7982]